jgi:hypothetical protein
MTDESQETSQRTLIWVGEQSNEGWGCSECVWVFKPDGWLTLGKSLLETIWDLQMQLSDEFAAHTCTKPRRKAPLILPDMPYGNDA